MTVFARKQAAIGVALLVITLLAAPGAFGASPGAAPAWSHRDVPICGQPGADEAACMSIARLLYADGLEYRAATPAQLQAAVRAAASVSYTAVGIRTAYGITGTGDASRVIAIIDAYDDPGAYSNLTTYRAAMLSEDAPIDSCTVDQLRSRTAGSTPCFVKVNQTGGTTLPRANSGWANEIDLDLQAASAICPRCSLLLLEASSATFTNLGTAVTTAAGITSASDSAHVVAISNSYGTTSDVSGAAYPAWDNAAGQGLAVTASSGDSGYATSFPASATYVLGVGGTTLSVDSSGARSNETAWSGAGSGCSTYNAAPAWQFSATWQASTQGIANPCGSKKAVADLSADADPSSGLQVYTTYNGKTGWYVFGGTSLSSPLIAALYAMQGGYDRSTLAGAYAWASTTRYYDVTSGSNGTCSPSVLCTAQGGWDGPSGLGSILVAAGPPVLQAITVSPTSASVLTGGTQLFTASGSDQYGDPYTLTNVIWSVNGGGTIDDTGQFTAGTTPGTYTVTATSGSVSGTASVTVTAPVAASFTLSASPSSRTIKPGRSTSYTISITRSSGFTDPVSFSVAVSDSPAGVSGTFSPNPATGTSTKLTITTTSSSPRGTYTLTITGTSGSLTATTTAALTLR